VNPKYAFILLFFYTSSVFAQDVSEVCGLFSPYQINLETFLRFDSKSQFSNMELDIYNFNINNKRAQQVDLFINISSPNNIPGKRSPLNLCFALDISGSMTENNRMEKLKSALKKVLPLLTSDDYLSVVVYDDIAQVVLPSRKYNSEHDSVFLEIIDNIKIGGGTNMLAGMLKGYSELSKNYNRFWKNRLILMSDGVSTTGEKNPDKITEYATVNNAKGFETSTIGLGGNINFELLYNIAIEGRGNSHFIGDCESSDIEQSLIEELTSLNQGLDNMFIEIEYPKHLKLANIHGASKATDNKNLVIYFSSLIKQEQYTLVSFITNKKRNKPILVTLNYKEEGVNKQMSRQISCFNDSSPSSQMVLIKQLIETLNCIKTNLFFDKKDKLNDCFNGVDMNAMPQRLVEMISLSN